MWEAFEHAAFNELDNLTAIIDVNRLGQTRETMVGWDLDALRPPRRGVRLARDRDRRPRRRRDRRAPTPRPRRRPAARRRSSPRRKKGKGVKAVEDQPGKHGKPLDDPEAAIAELGGERDIAVELAAPEAGRAARVRRSPAASCRAGSSATEVATRKAYGEALAALGAMPWRRRRARRRGVQLDPLRAVPRGAPGPLLRDVHRRAAARRRGGRHAGRAAGCRSRRRSRRSSRARTTSSAWRRSRARTCASGSHAGVSIGEDGPSQMALEDIAAFRAIHGSTVLHPSDANQTAKLVAEMADRTGISFIRTLRGKTEVRTPPDEDVGSAAAASRTRVTTSPIVACGITVDQAVAAAEQLAGEGVSARVHRLLLDQADRRRGRRARPPASAARSSPSRTTGPRAGWATRCSRRWPRPTTGRRSASSRCARCRRSGTPDELLHAAGIDAEAIAEAARQLARAGSPA